VVSSEAVVWALLSYRMPREPSTPRIAVWRKLRRLGVAQLGDGLVALPHDARTQEQLEWIAEEIAEAGGASTQWRAQLTSGVEQRRLVDTLSRARAAEYISIRERAEAAGSMPAPELVRLVRSLRAELRRVQRRDYFPPLERDAARAAVESLNQVTPSGPEISPVQVTR
jgi:hypothetical protein